MSGKDFQVQHRPDQQRFVAVVDGMTGFLSYELGDGVVAMTHTIVPPEIGGRGIAAELSRTAVAWARAEGLQIDPQCSYVRSWLARQL